MSQHDVPSAAPGSNEDEFVITRVLDVPRALLFKAWVEPEHLARWWGPAGFTMSVLQLDLTPGGTFHYALKSPLGFDMWGKFTYREIDTPERIVSILSFTDEQGNPVRHPLSPTWPLETLNTMSLTETDGKTTLTLRSAPYQASEAERKTFKEGHESMAQGFGASFAQLAHYLATLTT
jgi:uncharacterized protein YndB with AHSA1/START domain